MKCCTTYLLAHDDDKRSYATPFTVDHDLFRYING